MNFYCLEAVCIVSAQRWVDPMLAKLKIRVFEQEPSRKDAKGAKTQSPVLISSLASMHPLRLCVKALPGNVLILRNLRNLRINQSLRDIRVLSGCVYFHVSMMPERLPKLS